MFFFFLFFFSSLVVFFVHFLSQCTNSYSSNAIKYCHLNVLRGSFSYTIQIVIVVCMYYFSYAEWFFFRSTKLFKHYDSNTLTNINYFIAYSRISDASCHVRFCFTFTLIAELVLISTSMILQMIQSFWSSVTVNCMISNK